MVKRLHSLALPRPHWRRGLGKGRYAQSPLLSACWEQRIVGTSDVQGHTWGTHSMLGRTALAQAHRWTRAAG